MLIKGLYSIIDFKKDEGQVKAMVKLHKEHEVFKGHFPGNPVMPGVCMIQIIKELTEKAVGKDLFLSVASNVKFMAIINPEKNDILLMSLDITEEGEIIKVKNTVNFEETLALKLSASFKVVAT